MGKKTFVEHIRDSDTDCESLNYDNNTSVRRIEIRVSLPKSV